MKGRKRESTRTGNSLSEFRNAKREDPINKSNNIGNEGYLRFDRRPHYIIDKAYHTLLPTMAHRTVPYRTRIVCRTGSRKRPSAHGPVHGIAPKTNNNNNNNGNGQMDGRTDIRRESILS
ncbi:unnamed protein product [Tuber aestivum]|uniref:Uncharacterized protein n=1 Tax=Tuber aestivum TaxID=59557 RepID=A0A292PXN9_9PEZI|nr:unnamed protein product [Tuber aestivum]